MSNFLKKPVTVLEHKAQKYWLRHS